VLRNEATGYEIPLGAIGNAPASKKVMQFLREGRYVANVAGGKVTFYGRGETDE